LRGRELEAPLPPPIVPRGTDVDSAASPGCCSAGLAERGGFSLKLRHDVRGLERMPDRTWRIRSQDLATGESHEVRARFRLPGGRRRGADLAAQVRQSPKAGATAGSRSAASG